MSFDEMKHLLLMFLFFKVLGWVNCLAVFVIKFLLKEVLLWITLKLKML
jgi:hypothetical protein